MNETDCYYLLEYVTTNQISISQMHIDQTSMPCYVCLIESHLAVISMEERIFILAIIFTFTTALGKGMNQILPIFCISTGYLDKMYQ